MQNITGTKRAFAKMITKRGVYRELGVARSTANNWKRAIKGKDSKNIPSLNKMEDLLKIYGAKVVCEKKWVLPHSVSV